MDRPWTTAFFKHPVSAGVFLTKLNLAGDRQADRKNHGGVDKAVLAYSIEHYAYWRGEFSDDLPYGAFGENLSVSEVTEPDVCIGDRWALGDVVLEVSQPRQPCWKLARRWRVADLALRVQQNGRSGWYFRVLREGVLEAGQALILVERPFARWTIENANRLMHHDRANFAAALELAQVPLLSASWRKTLLARGDKGAATLKAHGGSSTMGV